MEFHMKGYQRQSNEREPGQKDAQAFLFLTTVTHSKVGTRPICHFNRISSSNSFLPNVPVKHFSGYF